MKIRALGLAALALAGCTAPRVPLASAPASSVGPVEVQILALNDFHGNLERPGSPVRIAMADGQFSTAPSGGAAMLGGKLRELRSGRPHSITVAAGDMIGASPLTSAYFLDEPTVAALNLIGLDLTAVGNHEFDKGSSELLRMQHGGCGKYTTRVPCRVEPFAGARFQYLGANVIKADGSGLLPASAVRQFGPVRIGFIGMTLKETGTLVTPGGVAGLTFADEAATANRLVPKLRAEGADAIVLLIHQGGKVPATYRVEGCDGLSGDILPILDKLDPAIQTVVSGHTHHAYACQVDRGGSQRLLTSAGRYGFMVSDIRLSFDPVSRQMVAQWASNVPVAGDGGGDPAVAALVKRYADAAAPAAARVVGRLPAPALKDEEDGESPATNLIADAQLAATRGADHGRADLSFINASGVRTDLAPSPAREVTYRQIFELQPFGNNLVVKTLTGAQIKALLEQQFVEEGGTATVGSLLAPSANFRFSYALNRPKGQRIQSMLLDGKPIDPAKSYRVTVNNFLASGGDGFSVLNEGTETFDAGLDLDALEAWLGTNPQVPAIGRTRDLTRR